MTMLGTIAPFQFIKTGIKAELFANLIHFWLILSWTAPIKLIKSDVKTELFTNSTHLWRYWIQLHFSIHKKLLLKLSY